MTFKLGRNRPSAETIARPRLMLADYMVALPTPPLTTGARFQNVMNVVSQMYANDSLGDCTKAGQGKLIGCFTGLANPPAVIFTDRQIEDDYFRLTGGQDNGLDLITVLEDWRDNKSAPLGPQHNIVAFASVDATNQAHVKFAIDAFLNGYFGIELPNSPGYTNPFPAASGFVMDVAGEPDPESGHCMVTPDYDEQGIIVLTWGMWGHMTWAAVRKYLSAAGNGEFHVVLTHEIINQAKQKTPDGVFDFAGLQTDFRALAA